MKERIMRHASWLAGLFLAVLCVAQARAATTITYVYDDLNRLQTVTRGDGPTYSYTYDEAGNIQQWATTNPDTDGDGLKDIAEINVYGTSITKADTDGDGLSDSAEVNTHHTNPTMADTDGDTLSDGAEVNTYHTNPNLADTDSDGFSDGVEIAKGTNPLDPLSHPVLATGDINNDGIVDLADVLMGNKIISGELTPTADQLQRGDVAPLVNGVPTPNGVFDLGDLVVIERKALGDIVF